MAAATASARRSPRADAARRPPLDPRLGFDPAMPPRVARRETVPAVGTGAGVPRQETPAAVDRAVAAADLPPPVRGGEGAAPALADPAPSRWVVSLTTAVLLHGLAVWALVPSDTPETAAAAAAAVQTIDFVALDAEDSVDATAGAAPAPPAEPEVAEKPEIEPPAEATVPPVPPVAAAEPTPSEAALPSEPPRPTEVTPPRPPEAAPAKPKRPAEARRKPAPQVASPRPVRREAVAPGAVADRRSGGAPSVGAAEAAVAREGELRSWRAAVLAALAAAKTYPEDARAQGRGGRAAVRFTVRRDGGVDGVALAASSGIASLDAATLAMPRRARFPAMPAAAGASQSFTAGVRYDLR
jgi:protein TonB